MRERVSKFPLRCNAYLTRDIEKSKYWFYAVEPIPNAVAAPPPSSKASSATGESGSAWTKNESEDQIMGDDSASPVESVKEEVA